MRAAIVWPFAAILPAALALIGWVAKEYFEFWQLYALLVAGFAIAGLIFDFYSARWWGVRK